MSLSLFLVVLLVPFWIFLFQILCGWIPLFPKNNPQKGVIFISLFVVSLIGAWGFFNSSLQTTFISFFWAILGAHFYFHLFNMSETARRIRILINIKIGGAFSENSFYSPKEMVRIRLHRLEKLGQIKKVGEKYIARPSLLLFASLIIRWHEKSLFPERKL